MRQSAPERLVTPEQIERILQVTDTFHLVRDQVVVPLVGNAGGTVMVLPDGKLLIRPPAGGTAFDTWFADLAGRLAQLDLSKTPRTDT